MEYASEQEKVLEDEGGWVDTHHYADKDVENKISEMKLEDASSSSPGKIKTGVLNLKINAQSRYYRDKPSVTTFTLISSRSRTLFSELKCYEFAVLIVLNT